MQREQKVNRELKASAFTAFFGVPENAAKLYEALSERDGISPDDITYTTLSGVLLLINPKALYKSSLIQIPTPEFFVFYNGKEKFPAEKTLKLSDAYLEQIDNPMLELTVKVININLPVKWQISLEKTVRRQSICCLRNLTWKMHWM